MFMLTLVNSIIISSISSSSTNSSSPDRVVVVVVVVGSSDIDQKFKGDCLIIPVERILSNHVV